MANGLLGTYIATFSTTDIQSETFATFAHGLGSAPDIVIVEMLASTSVATETNTPPSYSADATNISLHPRGTDVDICRCVAIVAHSIIS
jgi:hypothetical protein